MSPLHPWEWPSSPWSSIHLDYTGPFMGRMFLVLIDELSKWQIPAVTATATISCLQTIFATHGLPERVVSNNGNVFTSTEFKEVLNRNGISHSTSSPYHPASNGITERAIQCFKQAMMKLSSGSLETKLTRFLFTLVLAQWKMVSSINWVWQL